MRDGQHPFHDNEVKLRESKHCIQQKQEQTYQLITKQNEKGIHNKLYLFPRFRSYFHQPRKKKQNKNKNVHTQTIEVIAAIKSTIFINLMELIRA